jgi:hypothetical protein
MWPPFTREDKLNHNSLQLRALKRAEEEEEEKHDMQIRERKQQFRIEMENLHSAECAGAGRGGGGDGRANTYGCWNQTLDGWLITQQPQNQKQPATRNAQHGVL